MTHSTVHIVDGPLLVGGVVGNDWRDTDDNEGSWDWDWREDGAGATTGVRVGPGVAVTGAIVGPDPVGVIV